MVVVVNLAMAILEIGGAEPGDVLYRNTPRLRMVS
jgi:hypothetical protein